LHLCRSAVLCDFSRSQAYIAQYVNLSLESDIITGPPYIEARLYHLLYSQNE
jgi:hypothetical protein